MNRLALRLLAYAGAALLLSVGCADDPAVPAQAQGPDTAAIAHAFRAAISDPVTPTSGSNVSVNTIDSNVYVAFSTGELPNVRTVRIGNVSAGIAPSASYVVSNGALDPVAIAASVGDTLELTFTNLDGSSAAARAVVPRRRAPRVVRTDPPKGRTSVALNSKVLVVFSEPIARTSITSTSLQVFAAGQPVAGTFFLGSGPAVAVEFGPTQPLVPSTTYTVVVHQGITDLDGEVLERADTVRFTTAAGTPSTTGSLIAFVSCTEFDFEGECARSDISLINDDGSGERALTQGANDLSPNWSPDGRQLVFVSNRHCITSPYSCPGQIHVMNADGTGITRLTSDSAGTAWPMWSPDGSKIVFVSGSHPDRQIRVMNADGTAQRILAADRAADYPQWSPDGSKIAYVSDGVRVINVDGSGRVRLTTVTVFVPPTWSPDSRQIAYKGTTHIHVINADGTNDVQLAPRASSDGGPRWSPDGRRIAFTFYDATAFRIHAAIMDADGSNLRIFPDFGFAPSWSGDGARVAYFSGRLSTGFMAADVNGASTRAVYTRRWIHMAPVMWAPLRSAR